MLMIAVIILGTVKSRPSNAYIMQVLVTSHHSYVAVGTRRGRRVPGDFPVCLRSGAGCSRLRRRCVHRGVGPAGDLPIAFAATTAWYRWTCRSRAVVAKCPAVRFSLTFGISDLTVPRRSRRITAPSPLKPSYRLRGCVFFSRRSAMARKKEGIEVH